MKNMKEPHLKMNNRFPDTPPKTNSRWKRDEDSLSAPAFNPFKGSLWRKENESLPKINSRWKEDETPLPQMSVPKINSRWKMTIENEDPFRNNTKNQYSERWAHNSKNDDFYSKSDPFEFRREQRYSSFRRRSPPKKAMFSYKEDEFPTLGQDNKKKQFKMNFKLAAEEGKKCPTPPPVPPPSPIRTQKTVKREFMEDEEWDSEDERAAKELDPDPIEEEIGMNWDNSR